MTKRLRAGLILGLGVALLATACGDDALDPVVVFDLQPIEAQPWTASGELVEAGLLCPNGDRENLFLGYPDGSGMPIEELIQLVDEAMAAGGSHLNVARIGRTEYVCDDGSGTFTFTDEISGNPSDKMTSEVTSGSGAYVQMTGNCSMEERKDDAGEVILLTETCEFDLGSDAE
ncbi:MAG: hypothetical protein GY720_21040 [bacterium]|nr:hypothetical protein [bacterium]